MINLDRSELSLAAPAGVRVVALKFLADAHDAARRVTKGRDDSALHDFRVSIRRLHSWIRAFDDQLDGVINGKARRRVSRIADATNPIRDVQVQLEWLRAAAKTGGQRRRDGASWLEKYLEATTAEVHDDLRSAIDGDFAKLYERLSDRLSAFEHCDECGGDATSTIAASIGERIEPFVLAIRNGFDDLHVVGDVRAVHKVRIRVKRLRYLIEPVAEVMEEGKQLMAQLKVLQDTLGLVHDAHVMSHVIRQAMESAAIAGAKRAAASAFSDTAVEAKDDAAARLLRIMPQAGVLSVLRHLRTGLDRAFASARVDSASHELDKLAGRATALSEYLRRDFLDRGVT